MGQCFGLDSLKRDVEDLKSEHAIVAADVVIMKEEFQKSKKDYNLSQYDIANGMKLIASSQNTLDLDFADKVKVTDDNLNELRTDIVALHHDLTAYAAAYEVVASDMDFLILSNQFDSEVGVHSVASS